MFLQTDVNVSAKAIAGCNYTRKSDLHLKKILFLIILISAFKIEAAGAASVSISASSTTLCAAGQVTLTASESGYSSGGTYKWYNASTNQALASGSTYSPTVTATTGYYVIYTYNNHGTQTAQSGTTTITVSIPVVTFSVSSATANTGTAVTATLTSTYSSSNTYSWDFDGASTSTGTGKGPFSIKWTTPGVKTITLIEVTSAGCADTTYQQVTVGGLNVTSANYAFSQPITLNTGLTGISSTLYSFPALVYIKEDALKTGVNCANNVQYPTGNGPLASGAIAPNYDFAFTMNGSTTELFYEVDTYDPVNGILLAWVQIPQLSSANTTLNFYFGSLNPGHSQAFSQATWSSDYLAVYHFSEGSSTATIIDATSNGRNAVQNNTTITNDEIHIAAGMSVTGGAYSFNGTNTSIIQNTGTNPDITGTFTISAWVHYNGLSTSDNKIVSDEYNFGHGYKLSVKDPALCSLGTTYIETETRNATYGAPGTFGNLNDAGAVSSSTWTYIQGEFDGSQFISYLNGALQSQACSYSTATAPQAGSILSMGLDHGSTYPDQNFYNGYMDEVRVSNKVKSADWVKEEYYNQSNPLTYTICGNAITTNAANAAALGISGNTGGSIVYTWNGSASTDPANASNWKSSEAGNPVKIPPFDGTCSLDIPGGLSKYPVLTANESIYGLTLENGAQLNLNGYTLSVGCHIYNNSTSGGQILYGSSTGAITWDGALSTQYYYGNPLSNMTVGSMTVNNTAAGTVQITGGAVELYNTLTLTKGNLYINNGGSGSLTLMSTAAGSAGVAIIPSAYSVTGMVNVQRYLAGNSSASYRGYRLLTSPVNATSATSGTSNYISFGTLNSSYTVNGTTYYGAFTAGSGTGFSFVNPNPIIYLYDEALNPSVATRNSGFTTGKYVGLTSISGTTVGITNTILGSGTTQVPVGNSFILYFIGSTNGRSTTSNPEATLPDNTDMTNVGYLNQQTIKVNLWHTPTGGTAGNLSYTGTELPQNYPGYNMVGNPYASTIDLKQVYQDNYNSTTNPIGSNFYELLDKSPNQTFAVYSGSGGTSGANSSEYIASGQGFMAVASNTGQSLTFQEDQKVNTIATGSLNLNALGRTTNAASFTSQTDTLQGLHLKLVIDTANYDECGIYFSKNCKDNFDSYDAIDLDAINPTAFLSSYTADNTRVAINKMGDYLPGKRIKLYVSATADGIYKLDLSDTQNIDTINYRIYLVDNALKDSLDMTAYRSYTFNFSVADTAAYHNRFVLAVERKNNSPYQLISFSGQKVSQAIGLNWKTYNEEESTTFVLQKLENGKYVTIDSLQSNSSGNYNYTDAKPATGDNTYRLEQNALGQISYAGPITISFDSQAADNGFNVYPNPSKSIINVTVTSSTTLSPTYLSKTYNILGQMVDRRSVSANNWSQDVSSYKEGVYIIELTDANGNVVGKAKFIKVD